MAKRRSAKEIAYTEAQFALLDARSKIDDAVEALELAIVELDQAGLQQFKPRVEAAKVVTSAARRVLDVIRNDVFEESKRGNP